MPRNRSDIPREQRVDELVGVAIESFLLRGYGGTTMSQIAKAAGVANAALYWYFPTKDHLLAEVMNRALSTEIQRMSTESSNPDPIARLLKGMLGLRPYRQLHMTMHDRLGESEVVAEAHDRLIDWVRELVGEGVIYHRGNVEDLEGIVDVFTVLFEGLNVPGVRARSAIETFRTAFAYILGPESVAQADVWVAIE